MEGYELAAFRPRQAGVLRVAELRAATGSQPALAVQFETPDGVKSCMAEAAASEAMYHVRRGSDHLTVYGFTDQAVDEAVLPALSRLITAIETAAALWRDWNFAEKGDDGVLTKVPLTKPNIARLMEDADIRASWSAHLDAASPLERAEGNVSAASPNGNLEEAAQPVETATSSISPAPGVSPDAEASIAPASI